MNVEYSTSLSGLLSRPAEPCRGCGAEDNWSFRGIEATLTTRRDIWECACNSLTAVELAPGE